jgi:Tol biopolymer transport system component
LSRSRLRPLLLIVLIVLVLAGAAFLLSRPSATRVPFGITRLPWTVAYLSGENDQLVAQGLHTFSAALAHGAAAASPTGAHIVAVSQVGELWLVPTLSGQPLRLVESGVDGNFLNLVSPWSADGRALVYMQNGNLFYRRLSGSPRQLTTTGDASTASISPDGKMVAFGRKDKQEKDGGLWVVSVKGGEPKRIVEPSGDIFAACCPHWSPDGQWIAFLQAYEGGALGVARADGSDTRVGIEAAWEPLRWSPDSNTVYFPRVLYGEQADGLWSYSVADKRAGLLTASGQQSAYELSPDGTKMLVATAKPAKPRTPAQTKVSILNLPAATPVGETQTVSGEPHQCLWSPSGQIALLLYEKDALRLVSGNDLKTLQRGPEAKALVGWIRTRAK